MKFVHAVKRRYGLASRKMAVRTHVAWHWRGLLLLAVLSLGVAAAWWTLDNRNLYAGADRGAAAPELARMREDLTAAHAENARLKTLQVKTERYTQIDTVVQQDQQRELKQLQDENAQLKEEVAFFRGMMSGDRAAGVNIYRFSVDKGNSGLYRYQLLLVLAGQKEKTFQGYVQLLVTAADNGKRNVVAIPAKAAADPKFSINLRSYQRLEGDSNKM